MSDSYIDPTLPHYGVRVFLKERIPGVGFDRQFAQLAGVPTGPHYSTDLNAIVDVLNSRGYWWYLSHIEATVIPTKCSTGMRGLSSDGVRNSPEGYPIKYTAYPDRNPAMALCEAMIKGIYDLPEAFYVVASKSEEVWAEEPLSREEMMRYYEAREDLRQQQIELMKTERP